MLVKLKYKHVENSIRGDNHDCGIANMLKELTDNKLDFNSISKARSSCKSTLKIIFFVVVHDFFRPYIKWRTKLRPYTFDLSIEKYLPKPVFTEIVEPKRKPRQLTESIYRELISV